MDLDLELDRWRREWQAETVEATDLTARVERESRRMRRYLIGEIAVTALFGGGSIIGAAVSQRGDVMVLVIGVWVFLAIAWLLSGILRRGAWTPLATTTSAFLDLSIVRCRRRREGIVVECVLYVAILLFDLWWIRTYIRPPGTIEVVDFLTTPAVTIVWLITIALALIEARRFRRLGQELESLVALRDDLEGRDS